MTRYEYSITYRVSVIANDEEEAFVMAEETLHPDAVMEDYELVDWQDIPREEFEADERR